jgi:uncharacterized membrane protein
MSFESRLRSETPRWVAEGIITAEQAEKLHARHPEPEGAASRRFLAILSGLGAVLCAIGVALIIGANWQDIHRWVKLGALVLLLVGAHGGGYYLKWIRGDFPKLGDALLMSGCVLLILGIALVSQIFHLGGRPGEAVLWWIAGIAAVPFLARSHGAFFVLLVAVYAWLVIEATAPDGWLNLSRATYGGSEFSLPFVALCGSLVLYWTSFLWRGRARQFAPMQQAWPLLVACIAIYAAGFAHKSWWGRDHGLHLEPALVLTGLAAIAGAAAARANWREWRFLSPWLLLAAGAALVALANPAGHEVRVAASVLSWIALVVLNVFMARAGLQLGRPWLVNLAIAFIALNLFTRYFDLFASMLDQGLMFVVSGVLVLGVGWFLERKRRALLATMSRGRSGVQRRGENGGGP